MHFVARKKSRKRFDFVIYWYFNDSSFSEVLAIEDI